MPSICNSFDRLLKQSTLTSQLYQHSNSSLSKQNTISQKKSIYKDQRRKSIGTANKGMPSFMDSIVARYKHVSLFNWYTPKKFKK